MLRHWFTPLLFILGCVSAFVAIHAGWMCVSGIPTRDVLVILGTLELGVYLWVRMYSGLKLWQQIQMLCLFVSVQAAVHQVVRLDGFTGDARPIWVWRWEKTPQERFAESRSEKPTYKSTPTQSRGRGTQGTADLAKTTPWDSPAFRGRDRSGKMAAERIETDWQAHPPQPLWRQSIGSGWSTFAVVGDYCVTQEQRKEEEAVVCYEVRTGREVWVHRDKAHFYEATGDEGPRATPTIHNGRVYALGATGILNCLEGNSGKRLWKVNILEESGATNRLFGMAGSPLVVDDQDRTLVIVTPGGKGSAVAAYDAASGNRVWHGGVSDPSYSSPQLAEICGRRQVLSFNADGLFAHDLQNGSVLWSVPWISNPAERNNVCQPVPWASADNGRPDSVFISSGYNMGSALFEISREGSGYFVVERWTNRALKAKFSSVVLHQGHIYGFDGASLACVELATGERKWKAGHYGYGQLVLAGSNLLVQLEAGEIALVEGAPDSHREISRFTALDGRTWNHPVLAGNLLIVRNDREAACFELPRQVR
ncbi:MAG: PQQ-binding-like beta-propeller repeat protein [Pirellulaceae bacterium]